MKFRAVILDYPLKTIDQNPLVGQILGDVIRAKQVGFLQTEPNFVVMDKHDMIGTHFLIYDVENPFQPKLILAIRNTYEERAKRHGVPLPIEGYIELGGPKAVTELSDIRRRFGPLVDCNSWFVNSEYTFKRTGLKLSEVGFLLVVNHILRRGQSHMVGATNETYKASRWIREVGEFKEGLSFIHPTVPHPHCIALVDRFKFDFLARAMDQYRGIVENAYEVLCPTEPIKPLEYAIERIKQEKMSQRQEVRLSA